MTTRPSFAPFRLLLAAGLALFASAWVTAADKLPPKYPFTKPPLELIDELAKADPKVAAPKDDERALLGQVWEQKVDSAGKPADLTTAEQIDLFLIAGGVTDAAGRKKYRKQVAELVKGCEEELEGVDEPAERGAAIVKYVHAAMPRGYLSGQTSISVAFDTKQFNCVSASVLVYLVGTHFGLDLRPMVSSGTASGPGHAYLEWVPAKGGKRVVVENTDPAGFGWATDLTAFERLKNREMLAQYARGREVDAAGLAGGIYLNRGVQALNRKTPDFPAAARHLLSALALNPADPDAGNAVAEAIGQRGLELAVAGESERGVAVIRIAIAQAPSSSTLRPLARATWLIHLANTFDNGDDRAVAEAVKQAAKCLPGEAVFDSPAAFYAQMATILAGAGKWETGSAVFARGLKAVTADQRGWLLGQRADFFRRWSEKLVNAGDLNGSLAVLTAADLGTHDPALAAAVRHHAQAAARHPLAPTHLRKLGERFPEETAAAVSDPWPSDPTPSKRVSIR